MKRNKVLRYLLLVAGVLIIIAIAGKKAGWFGKSNKIKVII